MQEARGPVAQRPLATAAAATAVACLLALGKGLGQHGGEAPRSDRWGAGAALSSTEQQQQQRPPSPTKQPPQQSLAQTQAAPPTCAATATGLYGGSYSGDRGPPAARSGDGYEARHKGSSFILSNVGRGLARFLRQTRALFGGYFMIETLSGLHMSSSH